MPLAVSLVLFVFCLVVIYYLYQGPAYVPTLKSTVERMVAVAHIKPGTKFADLGSGDGRVVIAFAKAGVEAWGFEINPLLVWYSKYKIRRNKLEDKARISSASFWQQDLGRFDVVTVFGIEHVMNRLQEKIMKEMKPGSIVISNAFKLRNMRLKEVSGSLLVYEI